MSCFCKQCHDELFPPPADDEYDFEDISTPEDDNNELYANVLCEGCGQTYVNSKGECVNPYCTKHHGEDI